MSFVRPEAAAWLGRWREALIGAALVAGGLWGASANLGFRRWFALAVVCIGLAVLWEGLRRGRFRPGSGGPGIVEVDERQITYFGPHGGGAVSVETLTRVTILAAGNGARADDVHWLFESGDAPPLSIPAAAEGADQLFDAIAALPGADYESVLKAMGETGRARHLVWEKARRRLH